MSVAIATYNGRHLLETALPSLQRQTFRDFQTIVVDDASTDGTPDWLSQSWPDVRVIALERNVGVTRALNVCLRSASPAPLVLLLNNDMELAPDCLARLVEAMGEHPRAAAAAPKLLSFHRREVLDGAGDVYGWGGEAHRRGQGEVDGGQYDRADDVFCVCGGAALYRREALEQVGAFDERFGAIREDVDWSFRAQLAGWTSRYVPEAVAYHVGSATLGSGASDFSLYHNWRNALWTIAKDYPLPALLVHAPQIVAVQARNLAIAARRRRLGLWLRVWRDALRQLPAVLRDRREIQRGRVLSWRELEARVAGR